MPSQDAQDAGAAGRAGKPRSGSLTILMVDDNNDVREITGILLSDLGYSVVEADSGPAALVHLESGSAVDLVLVDLSMPGMSGFEMVTRARAKWPALKVLFVTGYADAPHYNSQMRCESVIKKPFTVTELGVAIRAALGQAPG